jgi:hypothetical protein
MTIFAPAGDTEVLTLNGTTSVLSGVLAKPAGLPGGYAWAVLNTDSDATVFVKFGDSTVVADSGDFPVVANVPIGIDAGPNVTHVAVIASGAATGTVYVTPIYANSRR